MIGKVLGGRYEIIEKIGGGGMALVYKAKCRLLDRFVAIKVLKDEFTNDEEFVRKFRRESQAAASLSHPNIVNIYDVGVEEAGEDKIYYIVMEYIRGKTLKQIIIEKGKIPVESTLNYSTQISEALNVAHENKIIHRDIKPHNIMITEDDRVKVTDFGIARAATTSTMTTKSEVLGSVHYFSPEQARGGYTDEKSDIYSLGIVMYEMVTGKLPYEGESPITVALKHVQEEIIPPRQINENIPSGFEAIILKAVQKRQADRYKNIKELLEDLRLVKLNGTIKVSDDTSDFDSHTKIIPTVGLEDEKMKKNTNKKKKSDKKGGGKEVFLGILLAFLLVTIMYIGFFRARDFFNTAEVDVPDLVGMQEDEAEEKVKSLGLEFKVEDRIKSTEYALGEVISQDPDADSVSVVKEGFPISVIISLGQDLVEVPSVVNRSLEDAERIIKDAGLSIGRVDPEFSDDIPVDVVISQSPEDLESVEPGSRVNLTISKGPEVSLVNMENLVGMTLKQAEDKLSELDLVRGQVDEKPSDEIEKGIVTWQSYEKGTELETKTSVDLYVSSGPEEDDMPPEGEAVETPEEGSQTEVEKSVTFTLVPLQDQEQTIIKIDRRQDNATSQVYNKTHNASEGEITITVQGKPSAVFDIYYNDIYQLTVPAE